MENATKALLIAGGVLIGIVMVTIGLYLYTTYSNQSKEYNQLITATEIQKFNSNFEAYLGRENITAQEIASVVNLAKQYNNQVKIYLGLTELTFNSGSTYKTPEEFIKNNQDKAFICKISNSNPRYDESGKIEQLTFTQ